MRIASIAVTCMILLLAVPARGDCPHSLPIAGAESLASCDTDKGNCLNARVAISEFARKYEEADKARTKVLSAILISSPWHAYGPDFRILRIDDLATDIRAGLKRLPEVRGVELLASWSGVRPAPGTLSIAEQLSRALNGIPVAGSQGFLWLSAKGTTRTTRQAFTMQRGGEYMVARDGEVMVDAALAVMVQAYDRIRAGKDHQALLVAGVAWETFGLCRPTALAAFEAAAELGNPIAAYNAAVIYYERQTAADVEKAKRLLRRAGELGDAKSRTLLAAILDGQTPTPLTAVADTGKIGDANARRGGYSRATEDARECLEAGSEARLRACAERFR